MADIHPFTSHDDIEDQASDWLARLDGDRPLTPEEKAELQAWMRRSPAHRDTLHRLARFWQQANVLTELSIPLTPASQNIGYTDTPATHTATNRPLRHKTWEMGWRGATAMVAVLLLSVALTFTTWYAGDNNSSRGGVAGNGVYETRIGEQNSITLTDGSTIELNTDSRVQVNYTPRQRGIVLMQGEAHFDVSKDPERPFEVQAGHGRVRAVGTAFSVRYRPMKAPQTDSEPEEVLQVTVTEGKVALESLPRVAAGEPQTVQQKNDPTPVQQGAVEAGQSVNFQPNLREPNARAVTTLDEEALQQALAWRDGLLLFSGEPLSEVVEEMRRYTEDTIEIVDPEIAGISIGGQFRVGETQAMLRALEISFGIDVRRVSDNHIQLAKKP